MPARRFTRIAAVVFDKDGVLVDTEGFNLRSAHGAFREAGHALEPSIDGRIVGRHPIDYVPELLKLRGLPPELDGPLRRRQGEIYEQLWMNEGRLAEGVFEALDLVGRRGWPAGMATSSDRREVESFLARFDLAPRFAATVSLDDVAHAKPAPEAYLKAARLLGVEPGEMLVVEDSDHGIAAAKAAGAPCVAIRSRWVPAERTAAADLVIDSLRELSELV